jgi:ornithine carbamoyltransferase
MKDYLTVSDLSPDELMTVLERAARLRADPGSAAGDLSGRRIGLFFEKPSARTRISTEVGSAELGMIPIVLKADEIGLGKRESVADVGRVFDRYLDVLALRVFDHANLVTIADNAEAPVINLLSDLEHPCQALADLQTIAADRPLAGTTVAYVGDGNNVCHSLMAAGAMAGMEVRAVTPPGYGPSPAVTEQATQLAAANDGSIVVTTEAEAGVAGADVVYTDVWASMGQEAEAIERRKLFEPYQVNQELFSRAASDAIFLHCLPAHRGDEATDDVLDSARSRIFDQAENRLHSFKALLLHLYEK